MSCFPSNYFDMALAEGDPVSYCLDAKKAVKELARVVKHNSHVIVSKESFNKLRTFIKTGILEIEHKFQAFTPEELRKFLKRQD